MNTIDIVYIIYITSLVIFLYYNGFLQYQNEDAPSIYSAATDTIISYTHT